MKIEEEIQQQEFQSEYQKAHINLVFTASWLNLKTNEVLKPFGISPQQFNVLRILKGLSPETASVKLITERMMDKTSNASRLVDKLKAKGYVDRIICTQDRRKVHISITSHGIQLLERASAAMAAHSNEVFEKLGVNQASALNGLLDAMRI